MPALGKSRANWQLVNKKCFSLVTSSMGLNNTTLREGDCEEWKLKAENTDTQMDRRGNRRSSASHTCFASCG